MGFFDNIKKELKNLKEDVSKIDTKNLLNQTKEKLSDIKTVVSDSYDNAKVKLEVQKEIRKEVEEGFLKHKEDLDKPYTEEQLNNPEEVLNKYLRKEIQNINDLFSLDVVIFKGTDYSILFNNLASEKTNEVNNSISLNNEVEQAKSEIMLLSNESIEKEEVVEKEVKEINLNEENSEIKVDSITSESEKENRETSIQLKLREKIFKYILDDVIKDAESRVYETGIVKKEMETVSAYCEVCNKVKSYDEMNYKEYSICSTNCLNKLKMELKQLNGTDIVKVLEKYNKEKLNKLGSKVETEVFLVPFNNLKLSDLNDIGWEIVGNHVFKKVNKDGTELYINYTMIVEKDVKGIYKVILRNENKNSNENYNNLISNEIYECLSIFNFMYK